MAEELTHRPIETTLNIIEFQNSTTKSNLQALKVEYRLAMNMVADKVIYKHIYVQSVKTKASSLHKKVEHFKNRFTNLFSKGMHSFWNGKENLIY